VQAFGNAAFTMNNSLHVGIGTFWAFNEF